MTKLRTLLLVFVVACSGSDSESTSDAQQLTGAACTNAAYDSCTDNSQCESQNCHLFSQSAFQVCVTACTPGDNDTCPVDSTGAHGTCNNMGICKPAQPNDCTR